MRADLVAFVVVALCLGSAYAGHELDHKSFKEVVAKQPTFIKFYAPWCGHCKKLEPIWDDLHEALKDDGILVTKVDCTAYDELCVPFGVLGYPTLKMVKDGKVLGYSGGRTLADMKEWALTADFAESTDMPDVGEPPKPEEELPERSPDQPSDVVVLTDEIVFDTVKTTKGMFVEVYADWCGHCKKLIPAYEALATELKAEGIAVAKVNGPENKMWSKSMGVRSFPTIFYFAEDRYVPYEDKRTYTAMKDWVRTVMPTIEDGRWTETPPPPGLEDQLLELWHTNFMKAEKWIDYHLIPATFITLGLGFVLGCVCACALTPSTAAGKPKKD